jgi:hypothetical protein
MSTAEFQGLKSADLTTLLSQIIPALCLEKLARKMICYRNISAVSKQGVTKTFQRLLLSKLFMMRR